MDYRDQACMRKLRCLAAQKGPSQPFFQIITGHLVGVLSWEEEPEYKVACAAVADGVNSAVDLLEGRTTRAEIAAAFYSQLHEPLDLFIKAIPFKTTKDHQIFVVASELYRYIKRCAQADPRVRSRTVPSVGLCGKCKDCNPLSLH